MQAFQSRYARMSQKLKSVGKRIELPVAGCWQAHGTALRSARLVIPGELVITSASDCDVTVWGVRGGDRSGVLGRQHGWPSTRPAVLGPDVGLGSPTRSPNPGAGSQAGSEIADGEAPAPSEAGSAELEGGGWRAPVREQSDLWCTRALSRRAAAGAGG